MEEKKQIKHEVKFCEEKVLGYHSSKYYCQHRIWNPIFSDTLPRYIRTNPQWFYSILRIPMLDFSRNITMTIIVLGFDMYCEKHEWRSIPLKHFENKMQLCKTWWRETSETCGDRYLLTFEFLKKCEFIQDSV